MNIAEALELSLSVIKRNKIIGLNNSLKAAWELKKEPLKMRSYPLIVQIEPTTFCNLRCKMCINAAPRAQSKHLTLDEFIRIIDCMPFLRKISLVGAGEPLLNPELFDIISYAKSRDILIGFTTNGMLLDERAGRKIIGERVDWLNISIDSADKVEFEAIRHGADFDLIVNNIIGFVKMKRLNSKPKLALWYVLMKSNLGGLGRIVAFAKKAGIDSLNLQLQHSWGDSSAKDSISWQNLKHLYGEFKCALVQARKYSLSEGINFNFVNVPDIYSKRACKWPWRSCYITAGGMITPCCLHGSNPENLNFGNIFENGFMGIWNSPQYRSFRRQLKSRDMPHLCVNCPGYYEKIRV